MPRPFTSLALGLVSLAAWTACGGEPEPVATPDPDTRRSLSAGPVVGLASQYDAHAWLGLPFAAPPTDSRRWRAPRPPEPFDDTFEAVAFGSPCPQLASPFGGVVDREPGEFAGDEDCLTLNVYAPRFAPGDVPRGDARLPVMVWIHGGGNVIGHASFYDAGRLAVAGGVIVVTTNYRLGPLGWQRHAALRGEGTDPADRSGNFGTLDQIRALEWVRDNVAGFGGDPDNVTIFGESAGGRDVFALLLAPGARGLFHRAISQSGSTRLVPPSEAENWADAAEPGHRNSSNEVLARLLVSPGLRRRPGRSPTRGRRDGRRRTRGLLAEPGRRDPDPRLPARVGRGTDRRARRLRRRRRPALGRSTRLLSTPGAHAAVPVMLGSTRDENKTFMFADERRVKRWFGLIPRLRDADRYNATAAALSSMWKANGVDTPAAALVKGAHPACTPTAGTGTSSPPSWGADLGVMLGAGHGLEIPFVFGHYDLGPKATSSSTTGTRRVAKSCRAG